MRTEQLAKCIEPLQNRRASFPIYNMFKLFHDLRFQGGASVVVLLPVKNSFGAGENSDQPGHYVQLESNQSLRCPLEGNP